MNFRALPAVFVMSFDEMLVRSYFLYILPFFVVQDVA